MESGLTTVEIISASKDIVLACAALVTVSIAVYGVKSWSRELRGKASFEVACGLIRATYKFRDELGYSRSPWTSASEFPKDYSPMQRDRTPEKEAEAWAYVFNNRWRPVAEAQLEFEAQVLEAEALWGSDIKLKTNELRQCARNLRVAMEAMVVNEASGKENFNSDKEFGEEIKSDVWAIKEDTNKLSRKIKSAVTEIEETVRPHIKRK